MSISLKQEIYHHNLNVLKKRFPNIVEKLNLFAEEQTTDLVTAIIDSKDGNKSLVIQYEGKNMYIHSRYNPIEEAKRWSDNLNISERSVIVVFGFGLGYYSKELLKKMKENNILIIVEPSLKVFSEIIKNIDCKDIFADERVYLVLENENLLWDLITWENVNNIILKSIPNYNKLFLIQYKTFVETIRKIMYVRSTDRNTIFFFAEKWQKNVFENIHHIFNSNNVKDLFNIFEKKPTIIVSAGPSLNKNIHLLKEVKEKAIIICVDTALKVLLRENIKPDLVVSLDGDIKNYNKFKDINYDDIPLVYTMRVYPEILNSHNGEKFLFSTGDEWYIYKLFEDLNISQGMLNIGGSVATAAFDLAVKMGANPVIFIGQDLAYTDMKTHAEGTMYDGNNEANGSNYITVEDVNGGKVFTTINLYTFLLWFEKRIEMDKSDRLYIDATEGGARINGTETMSLKKAIDKYCTEDINVTGKLKNILQKRHNYTKEEINKIIEKYKEIQKHFNEIKNKCDKAIKLNEKLYKIYKNNRLHSEDIKKIFNKLDNIDNYIKREKEQFALVKFVLQPVIYDVINSLNEQGDETEQQKGMRIAKRGKLLYSGIKKAIDFSQPLLEECIKKFECLF